MANIHPDQNEGNTWLGKKGFDEAKYYNDETFEIGLEHSDETIKEKVLEAYKRNSSLAMTDIKVEVKDGVVVLSGEVQGPEEKKEAFNAIQHLTGVKAVKNLLLY